jgi:hypothetical protein
MRGFPTPLGPGILLPATASPAPVIAGDGAPSDGSLRSFSTGAVIQHFTKTLSGAGHPDLSGPEQSRLAQFSERTGRLRGRRFDRSKIDRQYARQAGRTEEGLKSSLATRQVDNRVSVGRAGGACWLRAPKIRFYVLTTEVFVLLSLGRCGLSAAGRCTALRTCRLGFATRPGSGI